MSINSDLIASFRVTESDVANFYGGGQRERLLPFDVFFPRPKATDSESRVDDSRTVYRFYGNIQRINRRRGKRVTAEIVETPFFRRQYVQVMWNSIADVETQDLPFELREIPVRGYGPLSMAAGSIKGAGPQVGKPDKQLLQGNAIDPVNGVRPQSRFWAPAEVTQWLRPDPEAGENEWRSITTFGVVSLKPNQVDSLAKAVSNWRQMDMDLDTSGFPMHLYRVPGGTGTLDVVRPKGDPIDVEVHDMAEAPEVDMDAVAATIITKFDEWLVDNGCPIKGWPTPQSHPDGWWSKTPQAQKEKDSFMDGDLQDFVDGDPLETRDIDSLVELAEELGVRLTQKDRNSKVLLIKKVRAAQS